MQAQDILDTTHQLEEKGMNRAQAESISKALAAAVEPLATKEDLAAFATKEDLTAFATKEDLTAFATKEELAEAIKPLATKKDLEVVEERIGKDMAVQLERMNTKIESTKVWLLGGLLAIAFSIAFYALQVATAAPSGEPDPRAGQSNLQPPEDVEQSAASDPTD